MWGKVSGRSQNLQSSRKNGAGYLVRPGCYGLQTQNMILYIFWSGEDRGPPSPTMTMTLSYPSQSHKRSTRKPQSGHLELGGAVQCGSCSSKESFTSSRPYKRDSCSQKAPRGRLAQPCHLTCSMDVTVSTESSCNRSRACSGLRLYSGSDQAGEEDGGQ